MMNAEALKEYVQPTVRRLWAAVALLIVAFISGMSILAYYIWFEPSWLSYQDYLGRAQLQPELEPDPQHKSVMLRTTVQQVVAGEVMPLIVLRTNGDSRLRVYSIARDLHCDTFSRPAVLEPTVAEVRPGANAGTSYINRIPTMVTLDDYGPQQPMPTSTCWIEGAVETQGKIRTIPVSWVTNKFKVLSKADAAKQGIATP